MSSKLERDWTRGSDEATKLLHFATKQARDTFQPIAEPRGRSWEHTELIHQGAKALYYLVVQLYPHDAPLWEHAPHETKMKFIAAVDDLAHDMQPGKCPLCGQYAADQSIYCRRCGEGA